MLRGGRASALLAAMAALSGATAWMGCVSLKDDGLAAQDAAPDDAANDRAAAGGSPGDATDADGAVTDAGDDALPAGNLWPNDVPVCWASAADQAAQVTPGDDQPHWIHDGVESSWGREANVRFGTWPVCPTEGSGLFAKVAIGSGDDGDGGDAGGDAATGNPDQAWGGYVDGTGTAAGSTPSEAPKVTFWPLMPDGVDSNARELAFCAVDRLFSRVLGLADDPAGQPLGAARCGDVSDPMDRLSPLQILRVRAAYGGKPRGSVVGFDGRCLSVTTTADGSPTQTAQCTAQSSGVASSNQRWMFDPWAGSLRLVESGLALDSGTAAVGEQSTVRMPVGGLLRQTWTAPAAQIRGIGGTCLDFQPSIGEAGALGAVLLPCGRSAPSQRFDFGPNASIRASTLGGASADAGMACLAVMGASAVGVAPCNGTGLQQWKLAPGGAIQSIGASGACLEAVDDPKHPENGLESGVQLRVASCSGVMEQQFDILGTLQSAGACLDIAGYARADGTAVWTWTCGASGSVLGNFNQWWDVFW